LPPDSVRGTILLVSRGICAFTTKAANAQIGGAAGIVLVDNRPGEANFIPLQLPLDAGMVSDLDGARLRAYLDSKGGRATVRFVRAFDQLNTGRSGVVTSFSSAAPPTSDTSSSPISRRRAGRFSPPRCPRPWASRSPSSTARAWQLPTSPAPPRC
jgi:hypothetical protein